MLHTPSAENAYVELVGGERFDLNAPTFPIRSMAIALSRIPRFTGHYKEEIEHYSVLQHCLLVSTLSLNPLEGLLHDWPEAIVNDLSSPLKSQFGDYQDYEDFIYRRLGEEYGLPPIITRETHQADMEALILEAHFLMESRGRDYPAYEQFKYILKQGYVITPMSAHEAFDAFRLRWALLLEKDLYIEPWRPNIRQFTNSHPA